MAEIISNTALAFAMIAICVLGVFFVKATNKMFQDPEVKKKV
ncbi:MAG: hypothetical protein WCY19_00700 [Candidatus Gastranaerophilaceae bacterium]